MKQGKFIRILLIVILLIGILAISLLTNSESGFDFYTHYIFIPLQNLRGKLFYNLPFSIGDVVYIGAFLWLLISLGKLIYLLITFRKNKQRLMLYTLNSAIVLLAVYFSFLILWGSNYKRTQLSQQFFQENKWDSTQLLSLNNYLLTELSAYDSGQRKLDLKTYNQLIFKDYQSQFGATPLLSVKPTLYGHLFNYFGIQGFYNPFSGEGQIVHRLPDFMWPFVIAHEMAHQTGIANEGEANFLAYITCIKSDVTEIRYSGFFNLFLYANSELARKDSISAKKVFEQLPAFSKNNLITLKEMRKQYKSVFRGVSLDVYNWFLQNQGLEEGLASYGKISKWVYAWEQQGQPKVVLYP